MACIIDYALMFLVLFLLPVNDSASLADAEDHYNTIQYSIRVITLKMSYLCSVYGGACTVYSSACTVCNTVYCVVLFATFKIVGSNRGHCGLYNYNVILYTCNNVICNV